MNERSIRHLVPAALLALLFLLGGTGAAQAADPVSLAPADGARFLIGAPIDFAVRDDTAGKSVYVYISRSPATDAEGLIGHDVWIRGMSGAPDFTARWETSGLQTPGTYYWQAHRIDCFTPSYPDCAIEGPVRPFTLTGPTAKLSVAAACLRENVPVRVGGSGFTPGASVQVRLGTRTSGSTADSSGRIVATIKAPDMSSLPGQQRYDLKATETENSSNAATVSVRVTSLALSVSPSLYVRTGERVKYTFSGMPNGRAIYAHFRLGGVTRGSLRLGVARAPCGTLTTRAEMIPRAIVRRGRWSVQYDARRAYSLATMPKLRRVINVSG